MQTFGPYLDGWYDVEIQLQMHLYNRNEAAFEQGNIRKDEITTSSLWSLAVEVNSVCPANMTRFLVIHPALVIVYC